MNDHHQGIIWIDHREAKVFHVSANGQQPNIVESKAHGRHLQHKANVTGSSHRGVDREFFERVTRALGDLDALVITGPGNAKLELNNYLAEQHPEVAHRISAVEALDRPSDNALMTLAKRFYKVEQLTHRAH